MIDAQDDEYEAQCAAFLIMLDADAPAEAFVAEVLVDSSESPSEKTEEPELDLSQSWAELAVNSVEVDDMQLPEEGIYEPPRIWERPPGHAVQGVDAFKVRCHINSLHEPAVAVVGDSGAAPTLISHKYWQSLQASKPKARTGSKLKLIQVTGRAGCSEYVKLDLYFRSQLGVVRLKGVEAYVVKGMEANMIIGEDVQIPWQLHTIRPAGERYWAIGDSPHRIPAVPGPAPTETFTVRWTPETTAAKAKSVPTKRPAKDKRTQWNVVAKQQMIIQPESIATITAVSRGAPEDATMYLEGIGLKRGSDSFIQVPDGLVDLDTDGCFQVKIANTTTRQIIVRSGELLGHIYRANQTLKTAADMTKQEIDEFTARATTGWLKCYITLVFCWITVIS
jgi:hypothetical protein